MPSTAVQLSESPCGFFSADRGRENMGKARIALSLATIASLSGCSTPDRDWNKGIATPSATQLHYQREQAKTSAAGVAAVVAAAMGSRPPATTRTAPDPPSRPPPIRLPRCAGGETQRSYGPISIRRRRDPCLYAGDRAESTATYPHALLEAVESADALGDGLLVRGTVRPPREKDRSRRAARLSLPGSMRRRVRMVAIDAMETRPPR